MAYELLNKTTLFPGQCFLDFDVWFLCHILHRFTLFLHYQLRESCAAVSFCGLDGVTY